ncbi:MAG: serine/threonine protein kinase [Synechococcales cyanobacterium M58_A2018_015]|nr:serine/threonine protein kinase [Synechococcales cyanobacterium M58_A2018_015]
MDQLIHQVLHSHYRIQSLLGRQTGRRTFLAMDLETRISVVIKLLLFNPDFSWDDLKLFEREAETLKSLNHPAMPQYLDCFEVETELGNGFALVQSYIEARSLQHWVESGRTFSEAELKAIAAQVLDILKYLHSRQPPVIHRDIKPSNILLGNRSGNSPGQVYLVDFGSVQTVVQGGTVTIVGTYGYMPPEQFGGQTTPASDLYSLGATLIYLLTRVHPADLPRRRGQIQFDAKSQVSDRFQNWLKCLVHPEVNQRLNTAQQAVDTLRDDSLPLQTGQVLPSRPQGSRVILTKTDEQLQITIPAIPVKRKLEAVWTAVVYSLFTCTLLFLFLWHPGVGWFITPLVAYWVFRIWLNAADTSFETVQVTLDEQTIAYRVHSWRGQTRQELSPLQDLTRLEKSHFSYFNQSILNIWAGNRCYPIVPSQSFANLRQLPRPEVDWLAAELSDWLDLPIQIPDKHNQSTESSCSEETQPVSSTYSSNLPVTKRPDDAVCTVKKSIEAIEISAPAGANIQPAYIGCLFWFIGMPYLMLVVSFLAIHPWMGLILGALPIAAWRIKKFFDRDHQPDKILLWVDQDTVSLWRKSQSAHRLNQVSRRLLRSVQLVYLSNAKKPCRYHVQLRADAESSSIHSKNNFKIGNRTFWLSWQEAHWLAYELSSWLELPVSTVEVIDNNVA